MEKVNIEENVGKTYGNFTILGLDSIRNSRSYWKVRCICGNEVVKRIDFIKKPRSSCGCVKSKQLRQKLTTHGETKTNLYYTWKGVKSRTCGKEYKFNSSYVKRNIGMYEPWKESFELFKEYVSSLDHFGENGYSLDRIDNDKGYFPGNIRWATQKEQSLNRSANHFLTLNGVSKTAREWADELGIKYTTITGRIAYGWSDEDILTRPVRKHTINKPY